MRKTLEKIMDISFTELPRISYLWGLRFLVNFGFVMGWTVVVSASVSRYSIAFLPIIVLIQGIFTIVGMLLFSLIVNKIKIRQLMVLNAVFSIVTLTIAGIYYDNSNVFFVFVLMSVGIFLPQVKMGLSNYIEKYFSPLEAERIFPLIESSETIAGITAGIFLVFIGEMFSGFKFMLLWAILLAVFIIKLLAITPKLPYFLGKDINSVDIQTLKHGTKLNAIVTSVKEIKRVPFLYILVAFMLINWIISHFIEFQFTLAVDAGVSGDANVAEHESALTHGLGLLHILIHSFSLITELFIASRIFKIIGTFGGFLLHALMTFLSTLSLIFSYGFFAAVLAKNNFGITSVINNSSYESSYYAYKHGFKMEIRELFEGFIFPLGMILGTLLILGIQFFFLEEHYLYVIQLILAFLIFIMTYFAFKLRKFYTKYAIDSLSEEDKLVRLHAIEILAQRGHGNSYNVLEDLYEKSKSYEEKIKIIEAMANLTNVNVITFFVDILHADNRDYHKSAVNALQMTAKLLNRNTQCKEIRSKVVMQLKFMLDEEKCEDFGALAIEALAQYDYESVIKYLYSNNLLYKAKTMICLWKMRLKKEEIENMIKLAIRNKQIRHKWLIVYVAGDIHIPEIRKYIKSVIHNESDENKLLRNLGYLKLHDISATADLVNLLLYGNELLFRKSLVVLESMEEREKRYVAHFLRPNEMIDSMPNTEVGKDLIARLKAIYKVCGAYDQSEYVKKFDAQLVPIYNLVS